MIKNGYIVVNKQKGTGSTDYVRMVKKLVNQKKVGHSGTLDMLAEGVLVICLGKATKLIEYLQKEKKTYIATIKFGEQTDTLDSEGVIINSSDIKVSLDELESVIPNFLGEIYQIPPMYSALKKDGKRLYELAREGITIERNKRNTTIYSLEVTDFDYENQEAIIKTTVSAGTYIRTLIDDIGESLDNFAYMKNLIRTQCSGFKISDSIILENENSDSINSKIIPFEEKLHSLDKFIIEDNILEKLKNGMTCKINTDQSNGEYFILNNKELIGIGNIFETPKGKMLKLSKHLYT